MKQALLSVNGTGTSVVWTPDASQNPFQIGIGCLVTGATVNFSVQHTFDNLDGVTSAPTTWFDNSGITNATANIDGNYAFPVTGIRIQTFSAVSTTVVTAILIQADNAP
jgi:hypothetical protein